MDDVDIANRHAEHLLKNRIKNRQQYYGTAETDCQECENEIPELRRQAIPGATLCIACAELKESYQRIHVSP